jgi:hypothetical protein
MEGRNYASLLYAIVIFLPLSFRSSWITSSRRIHWEHWDLRPFLILSDDRYIWRMVSSGLLRRVALVITDVSEEHGASETSGLTRATRRNNPKDIILHSHRRENLKSNTSIFVRKRKGSLRSTLWFLGLFLTSGYSVSLRSSGQSFRLNTQRSRVRFPALPDFLRSSGSGTEYTQPDEDNWGAN